jgi:hypothetical protein
VFRLYEVESPTKTPLKPPFVRLYTRQQGWQLFVSSSREAWGFLDSDRRPWRAAGRYIGSEVTDHVLQTDIPQDTTRSSGRTIRPLSFDTTRTAQKTTRTTNLLLLRVHSLALGRELLSNNNTWEYSKMISQAYFFFQIQKVGQKHLHLPTNTQEYKSRCLAMSVNSTINSDKTSLTPLRHTANVHLEWMPIMLTSRHSKFNCEFVYGEPKYLHVRRQYRQATSNAIIILSP